MRRASTPKPGTIITFVPTSFGNAADTTPVIVRLRAPTQGERREHMVQVLSQARELLAAAGGRDDAAISAEAARPERIAQYNARMEDAIRRWVVNVENYATADGEPITSGDDLVACGEDAIVAETYTFIESMLSLDEGEKKGSPASSGCSRAETTRSSGTAPSASAAGLTTDATASEASGQGSSTSPRQG